MVTEPKLFEYRYVVENSDDFELLAALYRIKIGPSDARRIRNRVAREFGWAKRVRIEHSGRNPNRGTYFQAGYRTGHDDAAIVLSPVSNVEILAHELAHHHVHTALIRRRGERVRPHGFEFVAALDRIALFLSETVEIAVVLEGAEKTISWETPFSAPYTDVARAAAYRPNRKEQS